jgi:uncharacterized membrane protein AbrB (regulator of aidB expression)
MSFSLRSSVNRQMLWRTVGTLLVAVAAAWLCEWLRTPIPWMMGPLVSVAVLSVLGAPTESWVPFRNGGQWVIGSALGLYFTPAVGALVAGLWWAIVVGVAMDTVSQLESYQVMLGDSVRLLAHESLVPRIDEVLNHIARPG